MFTDYCMRLRMLSRHVLLREKRDNKLACMHGGHFFYRMLGDVIDHLVVTANAIESLVKQE